MMFSASSQSAFRERGVTIIEVLAAAMLIFLGLGAIFAMNAQSLEILRSTHMLANGSQLLQERMEVLRSEPWPQVANSQALSALYCTPAPSEAELSNGNLVEKVTLSIPNTSTTPGVGDANFFTLRRQDGTVAVTHVGDLTTQSMLLVDMTITWQEHGVTKQRELKTIIGRNGLTRSGIFGSAFGRPGVTTTSATANTTGGNTTASAQ